MVELISGSLCFGFELCILDPPKGDHCSILWRHWSVRIVLSRTWKPGVNFTNQVVFPYKSVLHSFYVLTICVCNFFGERKLAKKLFINLDAIYLRSDNNDWHVTFFLFQSILDYLVDLQATTTLTATASTTLPFKTRCWFIIKDVSRL